MKQIENWNSMTSIIGSRIWRDGKRTNVKELFLKMKEQKCDYLVILGCKVGAGFGTTRNARIEMLRVVQEMKDYSDDVNLQAWGMCIFLCTIFVPTTDPTYLPRKVPNQHNLANF